MLETPVLEARYLTRILSPAPFGRPPAPNPRCVTAPDQVLLSARAVRRNEVAQLKKPSSDREARV